MLIRHFRDDKGTGSEMSPAIVSEIVTGDVPVSYWPIFFFLSLVADPEVFAIVNSAQFPPPVSKVMTRCDLICSPGSLKVVYATTTTTATRTAKKQ